jgi:Uncharacterized protein conserved in bacteria
MGNKKGGARKLLSSAYKKTRAFINRPWFYNKKFLVTLSVICSVLMWATLAINISPVETKTISSVPITINVDTIKENFGLDFVEVISPESYKKMQLDVKVSGRKYLLTQLSADDFSAVASANKSISKPGSYDFTLLVTCKNPLLDVKIEQNSQQLYVKFDRFVEKEFTVSNVIAVGATIPEGNNLTMGTPYSNVSEVTVSGPETEVNQIDSVVVSADINKELTDGETFDGSIVFKNANGDQLNLSHVSTSTNTTEAVSVTIPVRTTKEFKVGVTFKNAPLYFDESKLPLSISPSTLTIMGTPDAINNLKETYVAGEIDLSKLRKGMNSYSFTLSLSTGLETTNKTDKIKIDIDLSKYKVISLDVNSTHSRFDIVNYTGTRKVTFNTKSLDNIRIIGPMYVVDKLAAKDIIVEADLTDKETVTGKCTVKALISVRNNSKCWAIGSYEVEVNIG